MSGLPCPNCSSELTFLEQYRRHYCYACGRYAPEGYGDQGAKVCPTCGGILSFVAAYERFYCYHCNAYPPEGVALASRIEPTITASTPTIVAPSGDAAVLESTDQPMTAEEPGQAGVDGHVEPLRPSEEIVRVSVPAGERPSSQQRRPLDRDEVLVAKKPLLMDLCKQYGLTPTGTKEELRERLLSYLDEVEAAQRAEEQPQVFEGAEREAPTESEEVVVEEAPTEPSVEVAEPRRTRGVRASSATTRTDQAVIVEQTPQAIEPTATPLIVSETYKELRDAEPRAVQTSPALHPCPTCGRDLSYIPQYRRWYCYSCRRYAPKAKAKFACPTCGASLRWISRYERWWCDTCRRYAPLDLPRPEYAMAAGAAMVTRPLSTATAVASPAHRHRSPANGIGLVGLGILLFIVHGIFVDLPAALSYNPGFLVAPDVAFGLRFFAFFLVAVGAILGLSAVRDYR